MNKKQLFGGILISCLCAMSCNSGAPKTPAGNVETPAAVSATAPVGGDNTKGLVKFTHVELTSPLNKEMIEKGSNIYDIKCGSCHKLTDEKLVGPGWKGVTDRHKPEWIMNFVVNTEEMLNKDPNAQALLEKCMVRMPNQNLKDDEARQILEFMRKNDGKN
jgi:cytochrome c2